MIMLNFVQRNSIDFEKKNTNKTNKESASEQGYFNIYKCLKMFRFHSHFEKYSFFSSKIHEIEL